MRLFTAEEMRAADKHAIEKVGIPGLLLMENAGIKALVTIEKILGGLKGKRFTIVCGRGNNGGDGLVIARHLLNNDVPTHIFVTVEPEEMTADARANFNMLVRSGASPILIKDPQDIDRLRIAMEFSECLLDCLFGTGVKGDVTGFAADVIRAMNDTRARRISIDMPSGLCATTGRASDPTFVAEYTVTLGVPKLGLFIFPGKRLAGEIWVADIGLPAISTAASGASHFLITSALAETLLPERDEAMHKGDAGKVMIIAGSEEYQGAGVMASYGALRSGAGLVTLALPDCLQGKMSCQVLPEVIVKFLPAKDGGFVISQDLAVELSAKNRVLLAGPGWGRCDGRAESVRNLILNWSGPVVLDADALNLVSDPQMLQKAAGPLVITPHIGEMSRLCKLSVEEITGNQIEVARKFALENKLVVVLKSAITIIADPRGRIYVGSRPNSGLARGGSGDLLAGLIAGLIATGVSELNAAVAAVHLLAEAADIAKSELGADSMTISEVASFLPRAFRIMRGDFPAGPV